MSSNLAECGIPVHVEKGGNHRDRDGDKSDDVDAVSVGEIWSRSLISLRM